MQAKVNGQLSLYYKNKRELIDRAPHARGSKVFPCRWQKYIKTAVSDPLTRADLCKQKQYIDSKIAEWDRYIGGFMCRCHRKPEGTAICATYRSRTSREMHRLRRGFCKIASVPAISLTHRYSRSIDLTVGEMPLRPTHNLLAKVIRRLSKR